MKRLLPGILLLAVFGAFAAPDASSAQDSAQQPAVDAGIVERTLPNGLKVVVWPDHDIPNVALYTWYRVGGRNEYPGITGLAHYFEHMMFNGTRNLAPGEFDRIMEASGGANNAYTSSDVTVYQDWFPASALETIFQLEADRMANLDFDPEVVESERGVVYSERRTSVDNNNFRALMEQVSATAFVAHPYQFPVIGWPSDIENWKMDDLKEFYRSYYAPNNATMFIVGDVEPAKTFALVEKYFAKIPAQPEPEPITTVEPEQQGERHLEMRRPGQTPIVQYAFHSGAENDADQPAREILLTILTDGDSSRLHRALVEEKQLAIDVGGFLDAGFDPGLAWFYGTLPPKGDVKKFQQELDRMLADIAKKGVSAAELSRAQNMLAADYWRGIATISGKAQALGSYEVFHGDYRKLFSAAERWQAVTREDVQRIAATMLKPENRTVGILLPQNEQ